MSFSDGTETASANAILAQIENDAVRNVDLRFTDLMGQWRHTTIEARDVNEEILDRGILFDGSAVLGWRDMSESDLLLRPDPSTRFLDPFSAQPALVIVGDTCDPATSSGYERDPRWVAQRCVERLADHAPALEAQVSVELGYSLFDDVRVETDALHAGYTLASSELADSSGKLSIASASGHRPGLRRAHLAMPPADHHSDIRNEISGILHDLGLCELRHEHGPAPSQHRLAFGKGTLIETCDRIQLAKYVIQQVASTYGKSATFMPKPLAGHAGVPLHLSLSLWAGDRPLFAGQDYADLSPQCLHFIAGILTHARQLNAFTNPTVNSYKRLREGDEVPTLLTFAAHNRSAAIRIPYAETARRKRIECRFADPAANPYLALAAIIMAGLDGMARRLQPGDAMDRNLYDLKPSELEGIPVTCRTLGEALDALDKEHGFLTDEGVVPLNLIEGYIEVKRHEIDRVFSAPTPAEFRAYFGC